MDETTAYDILVDTVVITLFHGQSPFCQLHVLLRCFTRIWAGLPYSGGGGLDYRIVGGGGLEYRIVGGGAGVPYSKVFF